MNIAELFVNLGIKGSEKTVGALTNVQKGLGDAKSMSIEAKAGILGAMYAMEKLFAASGQAGTGLTNFNALTGLSTQQLQQWQFAARQAGVSNEEFSGSLKAVQNSMTNMLLGKGAPEGLAMLSNKVGFDPKRARDTFYVLEQLQKFAKTVPNDIGNSVMKSFGLSEGTIAAMRRNTFTPQTMANAPIYSDKEIGSLDKANIAWSNLGNKIEMAVGHFNAKHGSELVSGISQIADQVLKLVEAFTLLSEKLKLFEGIGKIFEGWTSIFGGVNSAVSAVTGDKKGVMHGLGQQGKETLSGAGEALKGMLLTLMPNADLPNTQGRPAGISPQMDKNLNAAKSVASSARSKGLPVAVPSMKNAVAPKMAPIAPKSGSTQNINVNQNLNFQHDGKEHKKTSDSVKKATQDAFRQYQQGQVS